MISIKNRMKTLFLASFLLGIALLAHAQSGTNSPYSQYGVGVLSDQTSGFNRGMNGVGLGFHEHNQVNYLNPASYSSLDSLTFIFDAGISGQVTNFEENGRKLNANNSSFEYAVAGFRALKHLGVSFGLIPFSNVGYNYSASGKTGEDSYVNTYDGEGGLHQVFVGAGWQPVKGFSVGANFSYVWGEYSKYISNSYTNSSYNTLTRTYSSQMNGFKWDLGVQYTHQVAKKDWLTLGLTFSPSADLSASADMNIVSTNSQTSTADSTTFSIGKAYKLPNMYGAGVMWNHNGQLKVGVDYTLQQWGDLKYPVFQVVDNEASYTMRDGYYSNRSKINLGIQYCNNERHRNFFKRLQYRAGVSYATPYYKMDTAGGLVDGPKELSISAGFGIPIVNSYNNRSFLNISGQWVKSSAKDLIKENVFRINIGFTFNEKWFEKWKMN